MNRFPVIALMLALLAAAGSVVVFAQAPADSELGQVAIPQPAKPAMAEACVEPVEVMRREHMNFLMHQRDATVIDGERGSKHSLTGCMDCHNPSDSAETAIRYPEPEHFCAGCHLYASVKIDCFECHADRGLGEYQQSRLGLLNNDDLATLHSFRHRQEQGHVD